MVHNIPWNMKHPKHGTHRTGFSFLSLQTNSLCGNMINAINELWASFSVPT